MAQTGVNEVKTPGAAVHALEGARLVAGLLKFEYRRTSLGGISETIIIARRRTWGYYRVKPRFVQRSSTGAHGADYYVFSHLSRLPVVAVFRVNVSNRGIHRCVLYIKKGLDFEEKLQVIAHVAKWHKCMALLNYEEVDFDIEFWKPWLYYLYIVHSSAVL